MSKPKPLANSYQSIFLSTMYFGPDFFQQSHGIKHIVHIGMNHDM